MSTEADDVTQEEQSNQEMEAAFAASFDGSPEPKAETKAPAAVEQEQKVEEVKTEPEQKQDTQTAPPAAAITAPSALSEDQLKLLQAIPELEKRLNERADKVAGNYGEIKRMLEDMKKASATPKSAAAFDASVDGDYLDKEFPELAGGVAARIDQAVKGLTTGMTQEQVDAHYRQLRQRDEVERMNANIKVLDKFHPDRFDIQKTPQWGPWMASLPEHHREAVVNSEDPYYVSSMLSKFKSYRDKQEADSKKSNKRIEDAVTPTGVKQSSRSTLTEDEAAQAAFDAQFK